MDESRQLASTLRDHYQPTNKVTLTVLGMFPPMERHYANVRSGKEIGIKSEEVVSYLKSRKVLKVLQEIPSSNEYNNLSATKYVISYNSLNLDSYLDSVEIENFGLNLVTGKAWYKKNNTIFKPETIMYKLYKHFLENPRINFSSEKLIEISGSNSYGKKEISRLVQLIRKRIQAPTEHFLATNGYTFIP